ncbi:MAG: DUF3667 domain-containing protein [Lewinellaceae bacterium]|nr:DUF3667 domain-containing protein [Saprospiraceae bacterium]MCB9333405.1 DUF3667 domain-containing protein [Lewinellaceae bacterium]
MESKTQVPEKPRCVSCGAKLRGKFCHKCGEKRLRRSDLALSGFFKLVFEKFTHLDSRFLRSLYFLVIRPGFLTAEYLRGRRKMYAKPISLFFIINLIYFVTIGFNNFRTYENPLESQLRNPYGPVVEQMLDARFTGQPESARQDFEQRFDQKNHTLAKAMLLLLVPMLALVIWLLYPGYYYGEHLVTALHFQALMLIQNMVLGIILGGGISTLLPGIAIDRHFMAEVGEPILWVCFLAFFTFEQVYPRERNTAIWRALGFALFWLPVLIGYRFLVFLVTFYTA